MFGSKRVHVLVMGASYACGGVLDVRVVNEQ